MRCREMLAFYAGVAVLLMISAFTLGSSAQTLQTVDTAPHSHAVSVFDGSGPNTPLEGVDGDVTLQHRHKAGSTTASPPCRPAFPPHHRIFTTARRMSPGSIPRTRDREALPGFRSFAAERTLRSPCGSPPGPYRPTPFSNSALSTRRVAPRSALPVSRPPATCR